LWGFIYGVFKAAGFLTQPFFDLSTENFFKIRWQKSLVVSQLKENGFVRISEPKESDVVVYGYLGKQAHLAIILEVEKGEILRIIHC